VCCPIIAEYGDHFIPATESAASGLPPTGPWRGLDRYFVDKLVDPE
jgi:hypothetical protein